MWPNKTNQRPWWRWPAKGQHFSSTPPTLRLRRQKWRLWRSDPAPVARRGKDERRPFICFAKLVKVFSTVQKSRPHNKGKLWLKKFHIEENLKPISDRNRLFDQKPYLFSSIYSNDQSKYFTPSNHPPNCRELGASNPFKSPTLVNVFPSQCSGSACWLHGLSWSQNIF